MRRSSPLPSARIDVTKLSGADLAALCDVVTAARLEQTRLPFHLEEINGSQMHADACRVLAGLSPLHFPVAFPEVFLRERAGFDVLLGNPPWEKAHVEEHEFWCRHQPGLRSVTQRDPIRMA